MARAKVGTGELTPFKKSGTGSTSIGGSTNWEHEGKDNLTRHVYAEKATREESELTPFKVGDKAPGVANQPDHPSFREKSDCGIPDHGYRAFKT